MQIKVDRLTTDRSVDDKASLRELILSLSDWALYLYSKWKIILLSGILGGILGLCYALTQKPVYTSITSFVLEEGNKGGGLRSYAGLASTFGIDLGGGGGLFEGENILELYKSRNMITQTLLSEGVFNEKKQLLIERYIDSNKLREQWAGLPALKNIQFNPANIYNTSQQQVLHDSIMGQVVNNINQTYLNVAKKDKKLNIIYVTVVSPDELFSKAFNQTLVENVNNFYLRTKTKKNLENVSILQVKADSVRNIMTGAVNRSVVVADATPNQNPTRMAQRIAPIQNAKLNAEINQQVLGTLLQNLELAKISLLKETPLIQIVDDPILPLTVEKTGKIKSIVIGGVIIGALLVFILVIRRIITSSMDMP